MVFLTESSIINFSHFFKWEKISSRLGIPNLITENPQFKRFILGRTLIAATVNKENVIRTELAVLPVFKRKIIIPRIRPIAIASAINRPD